MPKNPVNPPTLFPSVQHGFSQLVVACGSKTAYISGQTAWDANKQIVGGTVGEQARQALKNLSAAMTAAGGTLQDVVSLRIYAVNYRPENAAEISGALREFFPQNPPASTWLGVTSLAAPEFLIEIEATAVLD